MSQPFFAEGSPAMVELESMIDRVGVRNVLYAIEHICREKAEHLATNWQDRSSAREWKKAADKIEKFAARAPTTPLDCLD